MMRFLKWFVLGSFLICGCGYRVGAILPPGISTIEVPVFRNSTQEPGIEVGVTNQIINQFQIDGSLKVIEEGADARLEGEIVEYRREPLRYTGTDFKEVSEYRLRLITHLNLVNIKTGEALWSGRTVEGEATYFVQGDFREVERTAIGTLTEQEKSQLPTLQEDLAYKVVESVVEGW